MLFMMNRAPDGKFELENKSSNVEPATLLHFKAVTHARPDAIASMTQSESKNVFATQPYETGAPRCISRERGFVQISNAVMSRTLPTARFVFRTEWIGYWAWHIQWTHSSNTWISRQETTLGP